MRFLTFSKNGIATVGVRFGSSVVDLNIVAPSLPSTLLGLIEQGLLPQAAAAADRAPASAIVPLSSIKNLPVLPGPSQLINLIRHSDATAPLVPGAAICVAKRLCAHLEPMQVPKHLGTLDYGAELAVVLKKGGRYIAERDVPDHIAGYTVFNGGTLRGLPGAQNVAVARNGDHTAPLGPELVTPEELPPLAAGLRISLKRNGLQVQSGTTEMLWNVLDAIARISNCMSLSAGSIVTMGTLAGTAADLGADCLRAGEILEAEIEAIGILLNPIANAH
jgi:acylpyruvate hydrolase